MAVGFKHMMKQLSNKKNREKNSSFGSKQKIKFDFRSGKTIKQQETRSKKRAKLRH